MSGDLGLRRDVVVLACAISAGVHGALAPAHAAEHAAGGGAFAASAAALGAIALALTLRPAAQAPLLVAAASFAALLAGYALAVTTGVPVVHPGREPLEGLALATKAVEAGGLLAALALLRRPAPIRFLLHRPKGTSA